MAPQNEDFQNNLVQALVFSEQYEKARILISILVPKCNEASELLYLHAMSLMQNGEGEAALQMVAKPIAANLEHARPHTLRGMILNNQSRDHEAIENYRMSMKLRAIADVANHFGGYMARWLALFGERILEIRYEDIVGDIDGASRTLVQFCGLEWDAAMARPDKNTAVVRTASVMQVREGVHKRSVGGWRRMKDQLEPFIQGLDTEYWPELD